LADIISGNTLSVSELAFLTAGYELKFQGKELSRDNLYHMIDLDLYNLDNSRFKLIDDPRILEKVDTSRIQKPGILKYENAIKLKYQNNNLT